MKAASLEELERRHPLGYTDRSGRHALPQPANRHCK